MNMVHARATEVLVCYSLVAAAVLVLERGRQCRPAGPPTRPVRSTVRAGPPTAIQRRPINEHAGADQRACGHYEGPPRACPSPNPPYHRLRDAFRPSPRPRERRRPVPLPMDPKCCEVARSRLNSFWARSGPLTPSRISSARNVACDQARAMRRRASSRSPVAVPAAAEMPGLWRVCRLVRLVRDFGAHDCPPR